MLERVEQVTWLSKILENFQNMALPFCLNPAKGTSRKGDVYQDYPA